MRILVSQLNEEIQRLRTFTLMQKYQKIKTCTKMALEADLPCGRAKTRCAQTVGPADRKKDLLPPYGQAIFVRVGGYESKEREKQALDFFDPCFRFFWPFWK